MISVISDTFNYVTEHWATISGSIALVFIAGERLAAITPTDKDNKFFAAVHKILGGLGLKFPEVK